MTDLEILKRDMELGLVAVDIDCPPVYVFDPNANHAGWCIWGWDELNDDQRAEAAQIYQRMRERQ